MDRPETSARAGRLSPESYHSQDGQASVLMDQAGERWSKVSESMSSSNDASLRSSISIRAADIFDRSLAWLDEELDSHSNSVLQSSSSRPGSSYSSSAVWIGGALPDRSHPFHLATEGLLSTSSELLQRACSCASTALRPGTSLNLRWPLRALAGRSAAVAA